MPRIAVCLAVFLTIVTCIGINTARYPVVWEMAGGVQPLRQVSSSVRPAPADRDGSPPSNAGRVEEPPPTTCRAPAPTPVGDSPEVDQSDGWGGAPSCESGPPAPSESSRAKQPAATPQAIAPDTDSWSPSPTESVDDSEPISAEPVSVAASATGVAPSSPAGSDAPNGLAEPEPGEAHLVAVEPISPTAYSDPQGDPATRPGAARDGHDRDGNPKVRRLPPVDRVAAAPTGFDRPDDGAIPIYPTTGSALFKP
jgi:hypothetical protein